MEYYWYLKVIFEDGYSEEYYGVSDEHCYSKFSCSNAQENHGEAIKFIEHEIN